MKLRMCSCSHCKSARDSKRGQVIITHRKRAARHLTKSLLKAGEYERLPQAVTVGYLG